MAPNEYAGLKLADGKYILSEQIGSGGMGMVYKAMQPAVHRHVAVKLIFPTLYHRTDLAARFRREIRALAQLSHPNVVRIFDAGEFDAGGWRTGALYFVMELLDGQSLRQLLRSEGPMSYERALPLVIQICGALEEVHRCGIVHRDLKPENIFVCRAPGRSESGRLLDFGLAKVSREQMGEGSLSVTEAGKVLGTPEFMSPEQALGRKLDARSDVYSLGVILYEALTGKLPFDGWPGVALDWMRRHVAEEPIPLSARVPVLKFSPALDHAVAKALRKRPENRFASASHFADALSGVLNSPPPYLESQPLAPVDPERLVWDDAPTRESLPPASVLADHRLGLGEVRASNADALKILRQATIMGAEADLAAHTRPAVTRRNAAVRDLIHAVERMILQRALDAIDDRTRANRWRSELAQGDREQRRGFGWSRLEQFLSNQKPPSLAAWADMVQQESNVSKSLAEELRSVLGLPLELAEHLRRVGQLRNVLAHQADYELTAQEFTDIQDCFVRASLRRGAELELRTEAVAWLEWVARCVLVRAVM